MIRRVFVSALAAALAAVVFLAPAPVGAQAGLPTPEQFAGHPIGADNKLVRWDRIVEYMKLAAQATDRVRLRELGKSTNGQPFIALEISAPDTLKNIDRYKELERKLYFQGGAPTDAERDEIFRSGKAVVLVTCSIHATEIGASQMTLELVHRLATDDSPATKKVLDNVIFILVPSLNPDGQIMVTDWFNKNAGTEFANSPIPFLYHPYVGHDNNRDMYMFTQQESRLTAKLLWNDWYPSVWLDEHQMGSNGARIFVMPATDPINPNVHPLIYRWNGIFGQSQAAALEAAGKEGIIYNSTYTNFWQGAMAWSGWWHNQVGLLTEVASVRVAAPIEQQRAQRGAPPQPNAAAAGGRGRGGNAGGVLPPPTDVNSRTEYPRPWLGGRWTLRDIVDYELIATIGLLETAADRRETLLRQIYEVNRETVEAGRRGDPAAILIPVEGQHDPRQAGHLVEKLQMAGVDVLPGDVGVRGRRRPLRCGHVRRADGAGVRAIRQGHSRTADLSRSPARAECAAGAALRRQRLVARHADGRRSRGREVTAGGDGRAWRSSARPRPSPGRSKAAGQRFSFDYRGPDAALAINRLLADGAAVSIDTARDGGRQIGRVVVTGASRGSLDKVASDLGFTLRSESQARGGVAIKAPRIGMYDTWNGGNMDEGWTRWVLEQYGFRSTRLHNADVRAGGLSDKYDAIILPDQSLNSILEGNTASTTRPEYRGGIGDEGVAALKSFVNAGGTLITLGAACDLAIAKFPVPVRNLKSDLTRDQHFAPGSILRVEVDTRHPIGYGMAATSHGFYVNSPFFSVVEGFASQRATVVARYPNTDVLASGWLRGENLMAGRAAVVSIDMNPGRIVLFGLRPQHRAQTHATFPMLFNALYLSTTNAGS